jgi:hypothetical protein
MIKQGKIFYPLEIRCGIQYDINNEQMFYFIEKGAEQHDKDS